MDRDIELCRHLRWINRIKFFHLKSFQITKASFIVDTAFVCVIKFTRFWWCLLTADFSFGFSNYVLKKFWCITGKYFFSTKKYFAKQTVFEVIHFSKLFTLNLSIESTEFMPNAFATLSRYSIFIVTEKRNNLITNLVYC